MVAHPQLDVELKEAVVQRVDVRRQHHDLVDDVLRVGGRQARNVFVADLVGEAWWGSGGRGGGVGERERG